MSEFVASVVFIIACQHAMHAERDIVMTNLSVRPSHQCRYCVWTNGQIVKLCRRSGRGITLVFWAPVPLQNSKGNSLSWGVQCMWFGEFCKYRFLSRKWYEIGSLLLRITNRKSQIADGSVSVPMTLSDLESRTRGVKIFWRMSIFTFVRFGLQWPNLAR